MLFEEGRSEVLVWGRHAAFLQGGTFLAAPELAAANGMLVTERFAEVIAFLKSPACSRLRTNNHRFAKSFKRLPPLFDDKAEDEHDGSIRPARDSLVPH